MDVESLAKQLILQNMTPEQQTAVLESIRSSVKQAKDVQKQRIGENVRMVVDALKKIEADIKTRYDETGKAIEKRVASIKDGKDGKNGVNGKDGRDGRPGKDGAIGPRGSDGLNGNDGRDGVDGVSVTDAHIDFDGSLIISLSSGRVINVGEVVAPDVADKIKIIANGGGTSQTVIDALASLQTQINELIPDQTGNAGKFLTTNGTDVSWAEIVGGLDYQGTWNATTNTPTLASGVGTNGFYYVTATAGSTNLDGITDWQIGDWAIYNGTAWQKIDQTNLVTSVAGRTGAVTLSNTDISGLGTMSTQASSSVSITGGSITGITDLAIADGGTGQSTANGAFNALAPSQSGNSGKYLKTNGTNTSWETVPEPAAATPTNDGLVYGLTEDSVLGSFSEYGYWYYTYDSSANIGYIGRYSSSNIISGDIDYWWTSITNLSIGNHVYITIDGVTRDLGEIVQFSPSVGGVTQNQWISITNPSQYALSSDNPSTAAKQGTFFSYGSGGNVSLGYTTNNGNGIKNTAIGYETGSTITTGSNLTLVGYNAEPSSATVTNEATFGNSDTTNTRLYGSLSMGGTSAGTSGQVLTSTGSGTAPTWSTPASSGVTSVTGTSPIVSSGGTTPAISLDTAYGDTLNPYASKTANYVLAAPNGSSGVPTFRAIVAADIPTLNQNTTGNANTATTATNVSGGTASVTTLTTSSTVTLNGGTANGVTYLNGSKVLTSGSALIFDGTTLTASASSSTTGNFKNTSSTAQTYNFTVSNDVSTILGLGVQGSASGAFGMVGAGQPFLGTASSDLNIFSNNASGVIKFGLGASWAEQMRLTSTGLGIGTSSPAAKLEVSGSTFANDVGGSTGLLRITSSNNTANNVLASFASTSTANNQLNVISATTNVIGLQAHLWSTGANSDLAIQPNGGNVGIGTTSPSKKLEVANSDALIYGLTVGRGAGAVASNTTVGATALAGNSTGAQVVAVGYGALNANTASDNTAIGYLASGLNTTGSHNTSVGRTTMYATTTGSNNTAIGEDALRSNTTASNNTAVGYQAGYSNTTVGSGSTIMGYQAAYSATDTIDAIGYQAAYATTTGTYNSAFGVLALRNNTSGSSNVALGRQALTSNTTASNNTAVGYQAGYSNTTGATNVFIGHQAGYTFNLTSSGDGYNTFLGQAAGYYVTTGINNTLLGRFAGGNITTGSKNTVVGMYNGNQGGLDIRTLSNYIVLSDGDGNPRGIFDNNGVFLVGTTAQGSTGLTQAKMRLVGNAGGISGYYAEQTVSGGYNFASNAISNGGTYYHAAFIENGTPIRGSITSNGSTTTYATTSDYRLKNVIGAVTDAGARIDAIEPIEYEWKENGIRTRGFLAHKFQEVYAGSVTGTKDAVDEEGNPIYQAMQASSSEVIADLIAEIQSLRKRLAAAGI